MERYSTVAHATEQHTDVSGRLVVVEQLTESEIERRKAAILETGEVECLQCGWRGRDRRYEGGLIIDDGEIIDRGTYEYNRETNHYDLPASSGVLVRECPKCHYLDNTVKDAPGVTGFRYHLPTQPKQGEWRLLYCQKPTCRDFSKPFLLLSCPGCGEIGTWHAATNHSHNVHGWNVSVSQDGKLTVSPEMWHGDCHFKIENGHVIWL